MKKSSFAPLLQFLGAISESGAGAKCKVAVGSEQQR